MKVEGATRLLVAHFGNGDEDDQRLLQDYFIKDMQLTPREITIIPGLSYGHVELASPEEGQRVLACMDAENVKIL